jgi:drug/metabolite transporter (DMT)-like permease
MSRDHETQPANLVNGPGAAAVLAAGIGCFAIAALACLADKSVAVKRLVNFYPPTGPLSGVTTTAVIVWLIAWAFLHVVWRERDVSSVAVCRVAFVLLALGLLLTFPPIADLL